MKKRRVVHTIKEKQARCAECGGASDFGVSSANKVLMYCLPCAKKIAKEMDVPAFAACVADYERTKKAAEN